jgi:hypothetical protein
LLEWHGYGRIAALEDMELFEQLETLKKSPKIPEIDVIDQHLDEVDPPFLPKGIYY